MRISTLACLVSIVSAASVSLGADHAAIVEEHLRPLIDARLIPGAVVAIHTEEGDSFHTIGTMSFTDRSPMREDTLFEIGSISKVFTGVLLADQIAHTELTLDTPLDRLLPEGTDAKPTGGVEITLRHLTTHTSGWFSMPTNIVPEDPEVPFRGYTRAMMFDMVSDITPKTTPGEHFEYSNLGVGVLGTVLADHAGGAYEAMVKERILTPLEIGGITITLDDDQRARLAPATLDGRETKPWGTMGPLDPAGMWVSDARDLLAFAKANLRDDDDPIDPVLAQARTPLEEVPYGEVCYNWFLARDGSTFWHNGMTGGYSSYMGVNPDLGMAVVVLTNGATLATTGAGEKIFQEAAGVDVEPLELGAPVLVDAARADRIIGKYASPFFSIVVTNEDGLIFAQLTNQAALRISPDQNDGSRFHYSAVEASLVFDLDEDKTKEAIAVTLHQNGMEIRCERVAD